MHLVTVGRSGDNAHHRRGRRAEERASEEDEEGRLKEWGDAAHCELELELIQSQMAQEPNQYGRRPWC